MEAKLVDSSPYPFSDVVGQIAVTATKEEWGEILGRFEWTAQFGPEGPPEELLRILEAMGV